MELSTPVVTLWEGVLALPVIGTLDSARTQVVMENLLQRIVETGASIAIIDITGVPTVDTLTAQHLLKTVAAARLMGADCIISGIRPQIAQTIVHLGVDLGTVVTKATLADAFAIALRRLGLAVVQGRTRGEAPAATARRQPHPQIGPRTDVERIPILKMGEYLLVTIQVDMHDRLAMTLQDDLTSRSSARAPRACSSTSRRSRLSTPSSAGCSADIAAMSRVLDAETVVVGMRPAVAITLVELGLSLTGVRTALNVERGMDLLRAPNQGTARRMTVLLSDQRAVQTAEDVVAIRQAVRQRAVELGFNLVDQTKIVTAASELARNTVQYGGGGTVTIEALEEARTPWAPSDLRGQRPRHPRRRAGDEGRLHDRRRARARPERRAPALERLPHPFRAR